MIRVELIGRPKWGRVCSSPLVPNCYAAPLSIRLGQWL
jgi:hypothetical protein